MTISVVNGFVCYSSCDVSKAKNGEDPHPSTDSGNVDKESAASSLGWADQPAVVFGGSLSRSAADSVKAVASAQPANSTGLSRSKFLVDVLA
jgi:hypothetical protein